MAAYKSFSQRKQEQKENYYPFIYDSLPERFRNQLVSVIKSVLGDTDNRYYANLTNDIFGTIGRVNSNFKNHCNLFNFITTDTNINDLIDAIEIICIEFAGYIYDDWSSNTPYCQNCPELLDRENPRTAVKDINNFLMYNRIGYEFSNGQLIEIRSKELHKEIVMPLLHSLVIDSDYEAVNKEYRDAFTHFRRQEFDDTLVSCCKAFESCMKIICKKQGWKFKEEDTAKELIGVCIKNKLFPKMLITQLTHIKTLLESGTPTMRNKAGAHSTAGSDCLAFQELAEYALHLTGTNILFLINCEKKLNT